MRFNSTGGVQSGSAARLDPMAESPGANLDAGRRLAAAAAQSGWHERASGDVAELGATIPWGYSGCLMRVLFLDIDGVLNRTGYRPSASVGLRSWIEPDLAEHLCGVLVTTGARLVLSSDWRLGRTREQLDAELSAAGIPYPLHDVTPHLEGPRWREIQACLATAAVDVESIAIVDDLFDMGPFAARFVRTTPLSGLDGPAARDLIALLGPAPRP